MALAFVVVLLALALGAGIARYGQSIPFVGALLGEEGTGTPSGEVVVEGMEDLNQLSTARWTESVVVTRQTPGNALRRALTGDRVLLVATGEVEAGVDLASLDRGDVTVDGERVVVDLPKPEITSSSLDEERTRVYDRDRGLLNPGSSDELVSEARVEAENRMVSAARHNGILDRAEANARQSLRVFLISLGFEEVTFR